MYFGNVALPGRVPRRAVEEVLTSSGIMHQNGNVNPGAFL